MLNEYAVITVVIVDAPLRVSRVADGGARLQLFAVRVKFGACTSSSPPIRIAVVQTFDFAGTA